MSHAKNTELDDHAKHAVALFERELGVGTVEAVTALTGGRTFLKFVVGKPAPVYEHALRETNKALDELHPYRGLLGLSLKPERRFPVSFEASCLLTLLTRATRPVSQGSPIVGFSVPYVPFQNREDYKVAQPASHIIVGRRGVGKSTLVMRAKEILASTDNLPVVIDMQAYSELPREKLFREVLLDLAGALLRAARERGVGTDKLSRLERTLGEGSCDPGTAAPELRRAVAEITSATGAAVFVFLDDCHLVAHELQPDLLHLIHGGLKGAGGWLKVAGLRSLLNFYDPATRRGLQVPGDAQTVSLDLTLEDPETAESHLRAIVESFFRAVGATAFSSVIDSAAFKRLVWANAGVPRDFLQMFARSLEHARRARRTAVTLSDVNMAIGEFGQQKMNDLEQDARNEQDRLRRAVEYLEKFCLENNKTNAFLVRSIQSEETRIIQVLSDLRIVHLIHQAITPKKAGERYEAYLLDYLLFTGFRRRARVREALPENKLQFKASELRKLPKLSLNFASAL